MSCSVRNNGQIFSNVITQPSKHNRDVASLEGPRQPSLGEKRSNLVARTAASRP